MNNILYLKEKNFMEKNNIDTYILIKLKLYIIMLKNHFLLCLIIKVIPFQYL